MDESGRRAEPGGRRGAWIFGGAFAAVLAILMFLSGTIYSYNLPQVTACSPSNGYLNKRESSSGFADWEQVDKLNSPIAGKIAEIYVAEGDRIKAGQTMFRLQFDRSEAERKLREIENSRAKLEIDLQGLYLRMEKARRGIADNTAAQAEARRQYQKESTKVTTNNDLAMIEIDIRKAEQALADAQILFDAGAGTGRDVATAKDSLESLYLKKQTSIRSYEEQLQKDADSLETLYRNISSYDKSIADGKADLAQYELDLESKERDRKSYDLQSEPYIEMLANYDKYTYIESKTDGLVLTIPVEAGQNVGENALMMTIGAGISYIIECTIPYENNFVFIRDTCKLSNTARELEGYVISIAPGERGKALKIRVESGEITAGETFDISFSRRSDVRYTLVPNGALNQDSDGYFLNRIKKARGLLGDEFVLERLNVFIGDSDTQNTVITDGFRFFEPIVLTSDMPVQPGDTVKLLNEADFYAD